MSTRRTTRRRWAGFLVAAALAAACSGSPDESSPSSRETPPNATDEAAGPEAASGDTVPEDPEPEWRGDPVVVFDQALAEGWSDWGWAASLQDNGPALLNLGNYGGWIVTNPDLTGDYYSVEIRVDAEPDVGREPLRVSLSDEFGSSFPTIVPVFVPDGDHLVAEVLIRDLLGGVGVFDRIVLQADDEWDDGTNLPIHAITLYSGDPNGGRVVSDEVAEAVVDCTATTQPISPYIYGINYRAIGDDENTGQWTLGPTVRRWGGNPTSRYDFEGGKYWNTALDYYFTNVEFDTDSKLHEDYLRDNWENGVDGAITVPMLGWIAKDGESYSFSVADAGEQTSVSPENPDAGNGEGLDGEPIPPPPPTTTSRPSTPAMVTEFVRDVNEFADRNGEPRPVMWFLDNEPDLWNSTHRDVHPDPVGYDELLELGIAYAEAIRAADPDAVIAGPASWGWTGYFWSAVDDVAGFDLAPDRRAHNNMPLLEWYLNEMSLYEEETGVRLLDVLDVHFYPQNGTYSGDADPDSAALRIRSTRALWDTGYTDESWIEERVMLIPRMQEWVDNNYPDTKLSIGEYSFGGENHISGAIAQAEALGRFGQFGLYAAYYWTNPPEGSPAWWAFRAFRNYDGAGGAFLDYSVPTTASRPLSLFASTDESGDNNVLVVINSSATQRLNTTITLNGCDAENAEAWSYDGGLDGLVAHPADLAADTVTISLEPWTVSVIELS